MHKEVQQQEIDRPTCISRVLPRAARSTQVPVIVEYGKSGIKSSSSISILFQQSTVQRKKKEKQDGQYREPRTHTRGDPRYRLHRAHICIRRGAGKCSGWCGPAVEKGGSMFGSRSQWRYVGPGPTGPSVGHIGLLDIRYGGIRLME